MDGLQPGLKASISFKVAPKHLASEMSSGEVRVFATPMLVAGMEMAAVEAVKPVLPHELTTVGTKLDISHDAATPLDMKVTFSALLTAISSNGKGLTFEVKAFDEVGPIGSGTHERVIVNRQSFEEKTNAKHL